MAAFFPGPEGRKALGIQKSLLLIETLIFVLPFLIVFYLIYEKNFFFQSNELIVITLIFVLVLGGLIFLRQIFDRIIAIAESIRRAEAGENVPVMVKSRTMATQLEELTVSFNKIMNRLERTTENLDQKVLELMALKELYELARKSIDLGAILNLTLEKAMMVTKSQIGSLVVFDKYAKRYRLALAKGPDRHVLDDRYINIEDSFMKYVISAKRAIIVRDIESDPRTRKPNNPSYGSPSFMSMPVMIENEVAAILNLSSKTTGEVFDENDEQIMLVILAEIGFALENANLHARIKEHLKEIQDRNRQLEQEISGRKKMEQKLLLAQDELEETVEKRTAELVQANESLRVEIEERCRAEDILRKSEERYRIHFANVSDVIYSVSPELTFLDITPSVTRLFGYQPEDILGQSLWACDIVAPACREKAAFDLVSVIEGDSVGPRAYEFVTREGTTRIVEVNSTPLVREERVIAVISVARDITERRQLEAELHQSRKLEALGALAGGIAHDFNNVLTGIQGHASLMLLDVDESQRHFKNLKSIEQQVRSGSKLTRQLLGFARGGTKLEVEPTDLSRAVSKTAAMFGRTRRDVVFHESYQDDLWTVEVDLGQMEQVLMNLFVNASQAMPGGGEISLRTENVASGGQIVDVPYVTPGKYIRLTVADTGTGMDEQTREHIFEPFFTTKDEGQGTGLGLSSAYGIIKGHGGFINVFSKPGEGAAFNIYLPISDKRVTHERPATAKLWRGSETILLVDDEESITNVYRSMLEMLGYRVLAAAGGEEAVGLYRENRQKIDLVIMDMIMPGLQGEQAFELMKALNSEVRVIMTSGYSAEDKDAQLLERGCSALLKKPFRLAHLSHKIREVLDGPAKSSPSVPF